MELLQSVIVQSVSSHIPLSFTMKFAKNVLFYQTSDGVFNLVILWLLLLLQVPICQRTLATNMAIPTLFTEVKNSSDVVIRNQLHRFLSQEINSGPLLPNTLACKTSCNIFLYFSLHDEGTVLLIPSNTSALVMCCVQRVVRIRLYSHISNAYSFFRIGLRCI